MVALLALAVPVQALGPDTYDEQIRAASERWLPGTDWLRFRAQIYQESLLDPEAVSPVGARGLAQFMPGTWSEVSAALGFSDAISPHVAGPAIEAGAYYLSKQILIWTEPRPYLERRRLGEAGYNAGSGNIIRAQQACRAAMCSCISWPEIGAWLPGITGGHALETWTYIQRIEQWHDLMKVQGQ